MPWHPIGQSRHASPALALEPANEFWQSALSTDPTQHQKTPLVPPTLAAYPNCYLYANQTRYDALTALFLFATPFHAVCASPLLEYVVEHHSIATELPSSPWHAPSNDGTDVRACRALELRLRLLVQLCADYDRQSSPGSDDVRYAARAAYAWLDAHLLMALAIDALGYAPTDSSAEMAIILARYSPHHYTALREADLPDMTLELERCNLFVGGVDMHKEDPFVDLFSKALPRSYDTKDLVTKVADSAVRNTGFFGFLKLTLAATQLGLYSHSLVRAPFAVRYAVYRLFFFEFDWQLRLFARTEPTPGTAASVRSAFDLSQLVTRLEAHQRSVGDGRIEAQYLSYMKSLVHTYESATTGRKAKAVESTEGVVHRSRKKTLHVAVCTHASRPRNVWSTEDRARACLSQRPSAWDGASLRTHTSLLLDQLSAYSVCGGLFAANAMSRLVHERNCGVDVYEQRRANGQLDGDAPAAPAEPFVAIDYVAAATALQVPRDHVVPSEERVQADALIFEWLTTSAIQFAAPSGGRHQGGARRKKSDFVFQNTLLLAVREYIVFALRRWRTPLRYAYERMVHWSAWETQLLASAERFRGDMSVAAATNWSAGELLVNIQPHMALAEHMPRTQFRPHRESFLGSLLHRFALVSRGYQVKVRDEWREPSDLDPVDAVLPRETELLLRYSLAYWQYPSSLPANALELPLEPCDDGATHHQPVDFTIEPVALSDTDLPATESSIRSQLVEHARYPLEIFHASRNSLARFAECRATHRASDTAEMADECVKQYVEWLAVESAFQFQLMYAFCRAVDRHLHVRSFPLPRHIAEHQMRALRNQNCMPTNAPVPPHLLRGLVCIGCARVATFLPPTEQRQSTMAFGNDEVRVLTTPSDDECVFAAMRRRGTRPLTREQLSPAESWLQVLHHRARDAPPVYDRYCGDESREIGALEMTSPEQAGLLPLDADEHDCAERAQQLFSAPFSDAATAPSCDRRRDLPATGVLGMVQAQMVARGRGRLGELVFTDALWHAVGERLALFGNATGDESFLLMGHSLPNSDARFTRMRFACKSHRSRSETKKSKQSALVAMSLETADDLDDIDALDMGKEKQDNMLAAEAQRARFATKQCRDAQANAIYSACGRELMREIDYLGRALYYTTMDVSKRVVWQVGDFVAICCDCLAATRSVDLRAIADRVVCRSCYAASRLCSGSVALRTARGESTKTAVTAVPNALSGDSLLAVQGVARQTLFSPSYGVLCDEVIGAGTVCALDRCKTVKSGETRFYGLEVLCDTDISNETFGFIYFCATHARLYRALFNSATRLPLSTVRYFMADSKRFAGNVGMHGNFLENIMRGDARATEQHFRSELGKRIGIAKRGLVQKRRAQRKQAIEAGVRHSQEQERATVERLLSSTTVDD